MAESGTAQDASVQVSSTAELQHCPTMQFIPVRKANIFKALAQDARANGLGTALHPVAQLLRPAHQRCMEELLAD